MKYKTIYLVVIIVEKENCKTSMPLVAYESKQSAIAKVNGLKSLGCVYSSFDIEEIQCSVC